MWLWRYLCAVKEGVRERRGGGSVGRAGLVAIQQHEAHLWPLYVFFSKVCTKGFSQVVVYCNIKDALPFHTLPSSSYEPTLALNPFLKCCELQQSGHHDPNIRRLPAVKSERAIWGQALRQILATSNNQRGAYWRPNVPQTLSWVLLYKVNKCSTLTECTSWWWMCIRMSEDADSDYEPLAWTPVLHKLKSCFPSPRSREGPCELTLLPTLMRFQFWCWCAAQNLKIRSIVKCVSPLFTSPKMLDLHCAHLYLCKSRRSKRARDVCALN